MIAVALLAPCVGASSLYTAGTWQLGVEANLYTVNTATGDLTLVGPTGIERIGGMAFDSDGTLYADGTPLDASGTADFLYTIDTQTGAATLVGHIDVFHLSGWLEGGFSFNPADGLLYSIHTGGFGSELYTIDTASGHATFLGPLSPLVDDESAIAFRGDGVMFGAALTFTNVDDLLFRVDVDTVSQTIIGPTGLNSSGVSVAGMDFDPETGVLYLAQDSTLYTVDPINGQATLVGSHAPVVLGALAFAPPAVCPADMNGDGILDLADVQSFISAFTSGNLDADLAEPFGVLDLADVQAFIASFIAGCP